MTGEQYKKLSLMEFDQAAEKFDDNDPSVSCAKGTSMFIPEKIYSGYAA